MTTHLLSFISSHRDFAAADITCGRNPADVSFYRPQFGAARVGENLIDGLNICLLLMLGVLVSFLNNSLIQSVS